MPLPNPVRHAFNRAQSSYNQHCRLQQHTGLRLIHLAGERAPDAKKIIDLGCGTGIITKTLAHHYPNQQIIALDIAEKLLATAKKSLSNTQVTLIEASFDELPKSINHLDLIFSNLALHWSKSLPKTLRQLHSGLNQKGYLLFSTPIEGTMKELNGRFSVQHFHAPGYFLDLLGEAGFSTIGHQIETISYRFSTTLEALRSIKLVGATHTTTKRGASLRGRSWLEQTAINTITYHIGYFYAKRET